MICWILFVSKQTIYYIMESWLNDTVFSCNTSVVHFPRGQRLLKFKNNPV
jgi:hypothetical protein